MLCIQCVSSVYLACICCVTSVEQCMFHTLLSLFCRTLALWAIGSSISGSPQNMMRDHRSTQEDSQEYRPSPIVTWPKHRTKQLSVLHYKTTSHWFLQSLLSPILVLSWYPRGTSSKALCGSASVSRFCFLFSIWVDCLSDAAEIVLLRPPMWHIFGKRLSKSLGELVKLLISNFEN